jgi:hypothetical protein
MKKRIAALSLILAVFALSASASALAAGNESPAKGQRASVSGIRAGVTCHDPCDDPFQLKAWVRGNNVGGLKVKFSVKGRTVTARCDAYGYAHYHLDIDPSSYPQGVVVKVTASVSHGGVTKSASTWFKPNYN